MAGSACSACAHDSETYCGDEHRTKGRCRGTSPDLLPAMELEDKIAFATGYCRESLDTNHGYAKEQVMNSELAKRQVVAAVASAAPATVGADEAWCG